MSQGLYQTLKNTKEEKLTQDQKISIQKFIKKSDEKIQHKIAEIVYSYNFDHFPNESENIPFKGKQQKKSLKWDLNLFPEKLVCILQKFISIIDEQNK